MADTIDPERRSRNMAKIKGRDTKPELRLRSALHRMGLRFRVCRKDLPGKPDVVFPRHRLAVQVRGCFWHQHEGCTAGRLPRSNLDYWRPKLEGNVRRDAEKDEALRALGWRVLVVWECELKTDEGLAETVQRVLDALGR
ncbi:very short patch repair endonuclease [Rhodovulum adriaticum]|nr:very short patch repair endonuclease [Rhodovulum adriaticum]MBK1637171.1 very short patch repair endonuclease [Rhodovulum adriaticum]